MWLCQIHNRNDSTNLKNGVGSHSKSIGCHHNCITVGPRNIGSMKRIRTSALREMLLAMVEEETSNDSPCDNYVQMLDSSSSGFRKRAEAAIQEALSVKLCQACKVTFLEKVSKNIKTVKYAMECWESLHDQVAFGKCPQEHSVRSFSMVPQTWWTNFNKWCGNKLKKWRKERGRGWWKEKWHNHRISKTRNFEKGAGRKEERKSRQVAQAQKKQKTDSNSKSGRYSLIPATISSSSIDKCLAYSC